MPRGRRASRSCSACWARCGRRRATSAASSRPRTSSTRSTRAGRSGSSAPLQIAVTVLLVIVAALISVSIVVTGPLARRVGDVIGLGGTAVTTWNIAKWPVIAFVVSQMIAFLYWVAPNVRQPGYRWISPGGIFAVVVWVVASATFAFYVANFGAYNKTYGSLAAVIIFLVWLWITNLVILLGAELNAELERQREIERGHPPDEEPFLPERAEA